MPTQSPPNHYSEPTTCYWQEIIPLASGSEPDESILSRKDARLRFNPPYRYGYPAILPDKSILVLPIRQLPLTTVDKSVITSDHPDNLEAVASLIINQASIPVARTLSRHLARKLKKYEIDVVVGLPTLGLTVAGIVAEELGLGRYVALGYSRKFWYEDRFSVDTVRSITSPGVGEKKLWLDPNLVPFLKGAGTGDDEGEGEGDNEMIQKEERKRKRPRVAVVDDAVSSGTTMKAALDLLREKVGVEVVVIGVVMRQGGKWKDFLDVSDRDRYGEGNEEEREGKGLDVVGVFDCPLLRAVDDGWDVRE